MSELPSVTIAGGSGALGQHIVRAFLDKKDRFGEILILTRDTKSPLLQEFAQQGAKLVVINEKDPESLSAGLKDSDIVVNAIGSSAPESKKAVLKALKGSRVRLYFPSEFGVDHRIHDFSNREWDAKKAHIKLAQEVLPPSTRTCSVYAALFLEHSLGPWYGLSSKNSRYEVLVKAGSPPTESKISFTSKPDIGRSVVELSLLPEPPQFVHLAGDTKTIREVAKEMEKAGSGPIEIVEIDLDNYKKSVLESSENRPERNLRFLMGEGKIDHSEIGLGNDRELINPGETKWKWKGVADIGKETGGKPFYDAQYQ